jgi:hypothetical protein
MSTPGEGAVSVTASRPSGWRRLRRAGIDTTREGLRLLRNALMLLTQRADYQRWSSSKGLEAWWDERTRALAALVPEGSTVLEFGAGRRQLEKYLPSDCTYIPSDLVDRGPGTLVCDLNHRPLPSLGGMAPTVAVFSGVLEYVKDPSAVIRWLIANDVRTFVLSFDAMPTGLRWLGVLRERRRRLECGYMNNLTHSGLTSILLGAGLVCAEEHTWTRQRLYRFVRTGPLGPANPH